MANRIFNTRCVRGGYTLLECLLASTLLSVSVVAISGAISASYSHDHYAEQRRAAMQSGTQLLNELSALPLDPKVAGDPSLMAYSSYTDQAAVDQLTSVVGATATAVSTPEDAVEAQRTVAIERKSTLTGPAAANGDFAVVSVSVRNGDQTIRIKRLVTAVEAQADR